MYVRKHVRDKYDPTVDEVGLLHANQNHAVVRYPEGREVTVSARDLLSLQQRLAMGTRRTILHFQSKFNLNWLGIDVLPLVWDLKRVMSQKLNCRPR